MDKKKIKIDKSLCIGCGACAGTYPDDIKIDDDGLAATISGVGEADAVDVCPVGAISVEE
ncbi:MAG: ferredoxin [Erysipelotrichaceae bacterium]|jgi:ferredoxin|nr:ferredoxin [Bacilli bacterium]NLV29065.1 ferredoxin [Erysipelotrichaceae bacterium]HPY79764.1 ferredoxin [Bacilli bacterium]HQA55800.1 ferredoxin [Bacilli bacterium]